MNLRHRRGLALALCTALASLVAPAADAASANAVRDDEFKTLQEGELENAGISSDGFVFPSYARSELGDTGAEIVWGAVETDRGVLCATGHSGKLIRVLPDGQVETAVELDDPEITAIAKLKDGSAVFGAAPSGTIFRLGLDDRLTTVTTVGGKFVWDLELDDEGALWAATGGEGRLYKLTPRETGVQVDLAYTFHSKNIVDLWIDREGTAGPKGRIYVAGQNPGWLYRYDPATATAEVVYDSESDEVRAIHPTGDGLLLATNTERAPTPQALNLTLRLSGAQVTNSNGASGGEEGSSNSSPANQALSEIFGRPTKSPKGTTSEIVHLTREGFARVRWTAPERPIHSIASSPSGGLLVAAGANGRVYELHPNDEFSLVADLREDYVVRVVPSAEGRLLVCARNGVVWRMRDERAPKAVYRSRTIDASAVSRWGRFYVSALVGEGQRLLAAFRTGNAGDADKGGWSEWTDDAAVDLVEGLPLPAVPARYLQYRLTMESGPAATGSASPSPRVDYAEAFNRMPNLAPRLSKIAVAAGPAARPPSSSGSSSSPPPRPPSGSGSPSGEEASSGGESAQGAGRKPDSNEKNVNVSWSAEDPNGDELVFALYYRAHDETKWKLIDDELRAPRVPLGVGMVGDGRYRFRVVASDRLDNPPGEGLEVEIVSEETTIDNAAPRIEGLRAEVEGKRARIFLTATDDVSLVSAVSVDLDGGDTFPLAAKDGLIDQRAETFEWTTDELEAGEHVLTVVATDRTGNTSARRLVFSIE